MHPELQQATLKQVPTTHSYHHAAPAANNHLLWLFAPLYVGGHGGNSGSSCPFATLGEDEVKQQWQRSNYHAKGQAKGMADKVSPGSSWTLLTLTSTVLWSQGKHMYPGSVGTIINCRMAFTHAQPADSWDTCSAVVLMDVVCCVVFCCAVQVGGDRSFDPSVYSHNIENNRQQQADSLQRSYVGSGDILAFHPGGR